MHAQFKLRLIKLILCPVIKVLIPVAVLAITERNQEIPCFVIFR